MIRISIYLLLGIALIAQERSSAQSLPSQWSISPDGRRLMQGTNATTGLYDSSLIRTVNITFAQSNFWNLLTANYPTKTNMAATLEVDGVLYDSVGVRLRGNTSYTSTGSSQKKSFNISMDYVHPNQDLMGYKTLNFNNCAGDKSFLREVFYLHQIRKHIPAARANYIHLFLNGQDWGLYPNVQQLNKDFYEEWFLSNDGINWRADKTSGPGGSWGDGTAALNYLGADTSLYQVPYTLKSSDVPQPWDKLVMVCSTLNNSGSNLTTTLPAVMDVDRVLWFLASEIAFTDDDSYVMKGKMDYYLYYEPETGRMTPIEYDGNSAFQTNLATGWSAFYHSTNVNYPLLNKLLAVPAWRQRYLAHMRTIINESLDTTLCNAMLDNYKNQIDAEVNSDPKKIYTYNQFLSEITVLKNFVKNRRNFLLGAAEVAQVAPQILNANYSNSSGQLWTAPGPMEGVNVTTKVTSTNGIHAVTLYYATGLVGNFSTTQMYDDGQHNDSASGDGIYGASIPGYAAGTWVRFYIEAAAANTPKSVSYMPAGAEHDIFVYNVSPPIAAAKPVVINEVMASNTNYIADNSGEYDDYIELYNTTSQPLDISGYYLTDNLTNLNKWAVPAGTIIPAQGYATFWADEDSSQGANHCNFKLSATGEFIYLLNPGEELVDSVSFSLQPEDSSYSRIPNGTGFFVIKNPTFGFNNETPAAISALNPDRRGMSVFPNPAANQVMVNIPTIRGSLPLEVRNSIGQIVYSQPAQASNTINTSGFSAGIYYVRHGDEMVKLLIVR